MPTLRTKRPSALAVSDVLDASALLAWLNLEPGADVVYPLLEGSSICAVNWSEVLQKAVDAGLDPTRTAKLIESRGVAVVDATRGDAILAAKYWHRGTPLSLADRFCLALAFRLNRRAVTADRVHHRPRRCRTLSP